MLTRHATVHRVTRPLPWSLKLVTREGGGWDVAEVEFEGRAALEQLEDGRVRVRLGDLRFEYSGEIEGRLRRI